jgi:excisionase family DNA binding protein
MTDPITVSVKEFCQLSGLCRDKVFELIKDGVLDSFKCGKLRLVSVESYRRWVAEQISLDKSRRVVPYRRLRDG